MLEKGTTLADYRVDGVLGRGGMGTVYEATQLSLHRKVALKVLAPHLSNDAAFRRRFRREGRLQAALEHDHIVTVYEAGETNYGLFLSMQLVRGCTLQELIVVGLRSQRSMRLLVPIGEALDRAHAVGLIHRDIKPQNILIDDRDHSYLADFGLMKTRTEASLTEPGHLIGTCDYVSPEQICGERVSRRSDLYGLAAVLYECLAGVAPYQKDSELAVLYAHVHEPPPRITTVRPELPAVLDEVIGRGMAKDPEERPGSARVFLREVERALVGEGRSAAALPARRYGEPVPRHRSAPAGSAAPTTPLATSRRRSVRRMPRPKLAVIAAVGVVMVPAAGFLAGRAVSHDAPPARVAAARDHGTAIGRTIGALDSARRPARARLAAARTPAGQASDAARLAGDHRAAARDVWRLSVSPGARPAQSAIASALTHAASGYSAIASGARGGSRRKFNSGRNAVVTSERELRRALRRLGGFGHAVR